MMYQYCDLRHNSKIQTKKYTAACHNTDKTTNYTSLGNTHLQIHTKKTINHCYKYETMQELQLPL